MIWAALTRDTLRELVVPIVVAAIGGYAAVRAAQIAADAARKDPTSS